MLTWLLNLGFAGSPAVSGDYFVDSNAIGANNGTSWTDAWTDIESAETVPAGSEVWVASDHSQTVPASTTMQLYFSNSTDVNRVRIISVNSATPREHGFGRRFIVLPNSA